MNLILNGAVTITFMLLLTLLFAPLLFRPSAAARRMLELVRSARPDVRSVGTKERLVNTLLSWSKALQARLGVTEDDKQRQLLLSAGIKTSRGMSAYAASRLAGPVTGIVCGSMIRSNTVFWSLSLAAVLYLVPDMWLKTRIRRRRERIRKSLPDALDLLVICVEAGLGMDQAMQRVGQELAISHPEIHQELVQVNFEQLAGKPRLDAWRSAAERTQVPEFSLFVNMLIQAERFGTPIIRALSRFGDEIRTKRRQRAEELAAKSKIKILFPLVLFIFPCIFIVLLAPAILNLSKNMQAFH